MNKTLQVGKTYIRNDGESFVPTSYYDVDPRPSIPGLEALPFTCDDGYYRTKDGRVMCFSREAIEYSVDWSIPANHHFPRS